MVYWVCQGAEFGSLLAAHSAAGGKVEKETDTDSPLDSSGEVGKQFTSDGAVGESLFQSNCWPFSCSRQ